MKNKYKYILYVLLFIAIAVLSLVVLNFYIKYIVPTNEANRVQQEQLSRLAQIIEDRDKALLDLESEKNQEIIEQVKIANEIKDDFYESKFIQLTNQISSLQVEVTTYQEQLNLLISGNETSLTLLNVEHQSEIASLTTQIDNQLEQIDKMTEDYAQDVRLQKIQYEEKLVKAENDNTQLQREFDSLIISHEEEVKEITNTYLEYIDQLIADITLQEITIGEHEETITLLHNDILKLSETYDKQIKNILGELFIYEDQIDQLYLLESREIQQQKDYYHQIINKLQVTIDMYENSNELYLVEQAYQVKVDQLETLLQETISLNKTTNDKQQLEILNLKNQLIQLSVGSEKEAISVKNSYEAIIEEITLAYEDLENTNELLTSDIEDKEQQTISLIASHETAINQLIAKQQEILQRIESDYNDELNSQSKNYESQLTIIEQELETYQQDYLILKNNTDQAISKLQLQIEQAIEEQEVLNADYQSEINNIKEKNKETTNQMISEYSSMVTKLESEVIDYKERLEVATNLLSKETEDVKDKYDNIIQSLKQEMAFYLEQIEKYEETDYFTYQISVNYYLLQINILQETILDYENIITELEVANSTITIGDGVKDTKVIYLTFDDGPSEMTIPILDILDSYNIKATFFVVYRRGYEDEYQEIYDRGHTIGNHTYSHDYSYIYASVDNFYEDMKRLDDHIYEITGSKTLIMRFPGGTNSTWADNDIKMDILEQSYQRGYIYYDWNASAGDGAPTVYAVEDLLSNATKNFSGNGPVYLLMHDTKKTYTTVEVLDDLIEFYLSYGYTFAKITYETPQCKLYNQPQ